MGKDIIKLIRMNQRQSSGSYGFYCPKTKMFYSVPNEQMYKELMTLMRQGFATNDTQQSQGCGQQKEVDLNEHYSKLMDEDIENIYNDPLFSKKVDNLELKEYDFWYFSVYLFPFHSSINLILSKTSTTHNPNIFMYFTLKMPISQQLYILNQYWPDCYIILRIH